ncbi:hypothetical protein EVAR_12655_1, partial [Eumeta japonica]
DYVINVPLVLHGRRRPKHDRLCTAFNANPGCGTVIVEGYQNGARSSVLSPSGSLCTEEIHGDHFRLFLVKSIELVEEIMIRKIQISCFPIRQICPALPPWLHSCTAAASQTYDDVWGARAPATKSWLRQPTKRFPPSLAAQPTCVGECGRSPRQFVAARRILRSEL